MNNLISIILPTYNGAKWIEKSIQSVIDQSYTNWELLVIDDGSTDDTSDIVSSMFVKDSRIRYIRNEVNLGIQKTLNKGIRESKGEYIARIDDDDLWSDTDKLKKQIEFLEQNPDHVLIGTGVIIVNENGDELFKYLLPETDQEINSKLLGKNCFVHSSVMFKKSTVVECGFYGEGIDTRHFEDYDLWLQLGVVGKLANINSYSVKYTMRKGSITDKNKLEVFKKMITHLKKYKNTYPNYYSSLLRAYARVIVYGFFMKSPIQFSLNKFIKLYKSFW